MAREARPPDRLFLWAGMKQQQVKKFGSIVCDLTDETFKLTSFLDDAIVAAELEMENDYEDTYYDTEITIHDDLTAAVLQLRKGYSEALKELDSETIKKITKGEIDIDNVLKFKPVMDHPPDPNLPYDWADSINEIQNSSTWKLSRYEVSKQLMAIIMPYLKNYFEKVRSDIKTIKELNTDNPTTTVLNTLSTLEVQSDRCGFVIESFSQYDLPYQSVTDFQNFAQIKCVDVVERLKELSAQMGFEIDLQPKRGRNKKYNKEKILFYALSHPRFTDGQVAEQFGCSRSYVNKIRNKRCE